MLQNLDLNDNDEDCVSTYLDPSLAREVPLKHAARRLLGARCNERDEDCFSTYMDEELEQSMQDALYASLPQKPGPRSLTPVLSTTMLPKQSEEMIQTVLNSTQSTEDDRSCAVSDLVDMICCINEYLGTQRFTDFVQFCEKEDSDDGIMTCRDSDSMESIGALTSKKRLSVKDVLSSITSLRTACDHPSTARQISERASEVSNGQSLQPKFDAIKPLPLSNEDYGPDNMAPDCYVRNFNEMDLAALTCSPSNFDRVAAGAGGRCLDAGHRRHEDLVPIEMPGWPN